MRVLLCLALLLLPALSAAAEPDADPVPETIAATVLEAFGQLGVEADALRVHDVDFWTRVAPRLQKAGRMLETAQLPADTDGLRPPLVDRALRRPLYAVGLAEGLLAGDYPAPLDLLLGGRPDDKLAPGEDPILSGAAVHPNVRWLARRLAALEDAVKAALPEGDPDPRLTRWLIDGPEPDEIAAVRHVFDRYAETDLQPALRAALTFVHELSAKIARSGGFEVGDPVRMLTERGLVIVGSHENDVHEDDAWLLVDPAGDDVYLNNAGGTGTTRRSGLCLDLGGDDRYESKEPFSQGAAWNGLSLLLDARGDDHYQGDRFCQGATIGGISVLVDRGGANVFEAADYAQGAAALGYGLLWSGPGDDGYAVDHMGQGLGRTGGYGVLWDRGGDDRYLARPTHESMYSKWTNGRTVHWSFAQGCGFGLYGRFESTGDDEPKGLVIHDMFPGGVGVIHDAKGDDVYEGSMYAQGTAYFYGLGICADVTGNDTYTATWYGQGAAPHFAVGILADGAGNDRYVGMHQVQGNGRDFSTGVLLDLGGDDVYVGEDRVQGCGDLRDGYGVFVDAGGNDRYDAKRRAARGWTTMVKPEDQPTEEKPWADYGVFLDLGGEDVYEGKAKGADGTTWKQKRTGRAIGVDR